MIPVSDLMQSNHPGYRAFCIGYGMNDVYHPVFFDYCCLLYTSDAANKALVLKNVVPL